jgi:ankyrin repeat protein
MPSKEDIMAVHNAIKRGNASEVTRLLSGNQDLISVWTPFGTWVHDAASYGEVPIVKWLLQQGLNVNAYDEDNPTPPLAIAAAEGFVDVARLLIESGATLDTSDSVRNPLLSAIVGGHSDAHAEVAQLLIDRGIDTTVRYSNLHNMNAMEFAQQYGCNNIVAILSRQ